MGSKPSTFVPGVHQGTFVNNNAKDPKGYPLRYVVQKQLGAGAFGKVFKVTRAWDQKVFALKVIPLDSQDAEKLVANEVKALQSLKHENVVAFDSSFLVETVATDAKGEETSNKIRAMCVVMEFIEGKSLLAILEERKSRPPVTMVMAWFLKILEACAYFHAQGCVHRDLKADNIVVTSENMLKIIDFGLAENYKKVDNIYQSKVYAIPGGAIIAMDPNVLSDFRNKKLTRLEPSADMWSLGALLFTALTGEYPNVVQEALTQGKAKAFEVVEKQIADVPDPSGALRWLLNGMLCPREDRKTAKELLESKELRFWKLALDPAENMPTPDTSSELMPVVATLMDLSVPPAIRAKNFTRLAGFFSSKGGHQYISVGLRTGVMTAIVKHLDDTSEAETLDASRLQQILLGLLSGREDAVRALEGVSVPVRKLTIRTLFAALNNAVVSFSVTQAFVSFEGAMQKLFELTKLDNSMGKESAMCMSLLLRQTSIVPFAAEYQLRLLFDHNVENFEAVYADYPFHRSPHLLRNFLDLVKQKKDPQTFSPMNDLFTSSILPLAPLLSQETQEILGGVMVKVMQTSSFKSEFGAFLPHVIRHSLPAVTDLIINCANTGVCTHLLSDGVLPLPHPLIFCSACSASVCAACARICHVNHSIEATLFYLQNQIGVCGCKSCKCRGVSKVHPDFQIPHEMDLVSEPHLRSNGQEAFSTSQSYWAEEGLVKLCCTGKTDSFEIFQSRGYQFDSSIRTAIVFYFEVTILEYQPHGCEHAFGVGIGPRDSITSFAPHMVGWMQNEYGYHSDDGNSFCGQSVSGDCIGRVYGKGDTIGCGIRADGAVFFTRNGILLRDAKKRISKSFLVFATVSARAATAQVRFNFASPFKLRTNVPVSQEDVMKLYHNPNYGVINALYCGMPAVESSDVLLSFLTEERWSCEMCTFHNVASTVSCEVCGGARGGFQVAEMDAKSDKIAPASVRVKGAGSADCNGEYLRTPDMRDDVCCYSMQRTNSKGVNEVYHVCRAKSTKTQTKKWWICRTDRNGIAQDIDYYILEHSSDTPPLSGWTPHKGENPPPTIELGRVTPVKRFEPGVGIMKASEVCLAPNYQHCHDASGGPLVPGAVGVVIEEGNTRCKVQFKTATPTPNPTTWWYDLEALVLAPNSPVVRQTIVASWSQLFSYILCAEPHLAGYVLWSIRVYSPPIFGEFAQRVPDRFAAIVKTSKLFQALLVDELVSKPVQPNMPKPSPPPKQEQPPPQQVQPTPVPFPLHNVAVNQTAAPQFCPPTAEPKQPAPFANVSQSASIQQLMSLMAASLGSRPGFSVLVRASTDAVWSLQVKVEASDTFESFASKVCVKLGKPRENMSAIIKSIEDKDGKHMIHITDTSDVQGLEKQDKLVVEFTETPNNVALHLMHPSSFA